MIKLTRVKSMKKRDKIEKFSIIGLFIFLCVLMILVPNMNTDINTGKLIINEVMLVNNNTIADKDGKYNDYIELYNGNDYDVNLYGYYLTDNMKDTKKWIFPDITIKAKEYMVIYASGKDLKEDELHTNFKLDSKGETIALSNSGAKVISKVYVKETLKDTSYGYNGKKYVYYYVGTPGRENDGEYSEEPIYEINNEYKLAITEYMTNNLSYRASHDQKLYSLIEIHNKDTKDINLKGFYLTDKEDNITKYTFPDVTIKKDDYLVVYASGLNKYDKNEVHTNFKLNNNDGVLVLSSPSKAMIDRVSIGKLEANTSFGLYKDKWHVYYKPSIGDTNTLDYGSKEIKKAVRINEVSIYPKEAIELYNDSNIDISLENYSLSDKSGTSYSLKNKTIKKKSYLVVYRDSFKFGINGTNDIISLTHNGQVVDTLTVNKIVSNISVGITNDKKVYYKTITLGNVNSPDTYKGFSDTVKFNIDGGYIDSGKEITLTTNDNSTIYYTLNGTFPTKNSTKYTKPIKLTKTTVIKAISYKDGYIESDAVSRTFIVGRKHNISVISVSTNNMNFYQEYHTTHEQKASIEYYDEKGNYGISFIADIKTSGKSSSMLPQKPIGIYLRKEYGLKSVNYPFFKDLDYHEFSSFVLRNGGTDHSKVHIKDAILTQVLKGEMDIDMQDYRPVAVYINGNYYGLYSLREKVNGDYIESKYGIDKDNVDLIKKGNAIKGNKNDYNSLITYFRNHDLSKKENYEYIKTQVDIEELVNYWIAQCFFSNSDLFVRNVGLWKEKGGKWRWVIYDLDYAYVNYETVPTLYLNQKPYYNSNLDIIVKLYQNSEFKDLYLKSIAKYLKTTFKPDRINKIVDQMVKEIEDEMKYHVKRWDDSYWYAYGWSYISSVSTWKNDINTLKSKISSQYNKIVKGLKNGFSLSDSDYKKYFGDI